MVPRTATRVLASLIAFAGYQTAVAMPQDDPSARPNPGLEVEGNLVRHPIWGVQVQIPGYEPWTDHGMSHQANFILAAHASTGCGLNLSMFVEITAAGATAEECRRHYLGNPEPLRKDRDVRLYENQVSPITYTLYDHVFSTGASGELVQNQLYGYWTRGDHCFELHVSSMDCDAFADQAIPILRSVRISEDTGATLETVAYARKEGGDPRDWRIHLVFAGHYLHRADPKNPERARRLYASALRLGGSEIAPSDAWLIEEGIGLSWLMQDDGRRALPHLERALTAAGTMSAPARKVRETIHNLACAHALAGEIEAGCLRLKNLLAGLGGADLEEQLKEIRADKQLKSLRKSDCYKVLLKELGAR